MQWIADNWRLFVALLVVFGSGAMTMFVALWVAVVQPVRERNAELKRACSGLTNDRRRLSSRIAELLGESQDRPSQRPTVAP